VLANPATRVCFRLGDEDARLLASGFASFDATDLVNLGVGDAVCRVGQSSHDFNVRVSAPEAVDTECAAVRRDAACRGTRERFGTPRAAVEAMIAAEWTPAVPRPVSSSAPRAAAPAPTPPVSPSPAEPVAREPVDAAASAARTKTTSSDASPPGRGGAQHKYLQALIKETAQALAYRATIEAQVGAHGRADVLLERDGRRIAVEISVTTTPEHEVENIRKCLDAGVEKVAVISPMPSVLRRIHEKAHENLSADAHARVLFASPEEFMTTLTDAASSEPKTVLGYKVKTKVRPPDKESGGSKQQNIAHTIAGALKRLKRR
jgi:hypothetical protein